MKKNLFQNIAAIAAFLTFPIGGGYILTSCTEFGGEEAVYVAPEGKDEDEVKDPVTPVMAEYRNLSFSLSDVPALYLGAVSTVTAVINGLGTDETLPDVTYVWTSSDEDIIRVTGDSGTATLEAVGEGSATITVACQESSEMASASVEIPVIDLNDPYPFLFLELSELPDSFITGTEAEITASVGNYPQAATVPVTLLWESSDPGIFTVNRSETEYDGNDMSVTLVAVAEGSATLTVRCRESESLMQSVEVRVEAPGAYNRIFIDFGSAEPTGLPWNSCGEFKEYSLIDEQNLESGVTLDLTAWESVTDIFDQYYKTMFSNDGPVVFNDIEFPLTVCRDQLYIYNKDSEASFTVRGLDPEKSYELTTMSVRFNGANNLREMSITVQGSGEPQNSSLIRQGLKCITQANPGEEPYCAPDDWSGIDWSRYCRIFNVSPTPEGSVTVTLKANKVGSVQQAHLNALVITPLRPEK